MLFRSVPSSPASGALPSAMPDGLRSPCVFPPGWWLPLAPIVSIPMLAYDGAHIGSFPQQVALWEQFYSNPAMSDPSPYLYSRTSAETSPGSSAGAFLALLPRFQRPPTCGGAALVWLREDFSADALGLRGYRSCEAEAAPHLRVGVCARMLPAGRAPDLPSPPGTGHTREADLLDPDRRPETRSTGHAGWVRCHRDTGASAATRVSSRAGRSHDRTGRVWRVRRNFDQGAARARPRCVSTVL